MKLRIAKIAIVLVVVVLVLGTAFYDAVDELMRNAQVELQPKDIP